MGNDIFRKIRKLRIKLERAVNEKGLNSCEVREISDKMDELINEYERSIETVKYSQYSDMKRYYEKSYMELKKITDDFKKFPSVPEWNLYAKNNDLLSNVSMEYISKLNWNYLKIKVERELNFKIKKNKEKS